MMFQKVYFIINPASGRDEPVLSLINSIMQEKGLKWEVFITKKKGDAQSAVIQALAWGADLIAVYGGDGTIMEASRQIYQDQSPQAKEKKPIVPLAILPGGTANIMAKELDIPQDTAQALDLALSDQATVKAIDMGLLKLESNSGTVEQKPFIIRVNIGFLAQMVIDTHREAKEKIGSLAYARSAWNSLQELETAQYKLTFDGQEEWVEGAAIMVANAGNIGLPGISLAPGIDVADGLLDIVLIRQTDMMALVKMATGVLLQNEPSNIRKHWQAKEIKIEIEQAQSIICDDEEVRLEAIEISVLPKSAHVLVPKANKKSKKNYV